MWTRAELKLKGKTAFRANYWPSVLVAFILGLLTAGATAVSVGNNGQDAANDPAMEQGGEILEGISDPAVLIAIGVGMAAIITFALLLRIFLFNPLQVGCNAFFRDNVSTGNADLNALKIGFQSYGRTFLTLFMRDCFLFLWALLLIVPAIVKSYSYRMVPFIIRDDPELAPREVINRSRDLMKGQKWAAFKLDLSFLGWIILSGMTMGIVGVFWTNPYYYNTNAALYVRLREDDPAVDQSGQSGQSGFSGPSGPTERHSYTRPSGASSASWPSDLDGSSGFSRKSKQEKPEWEL